MVAIVQQPAPVFTATAVINGEFEEISLDDYSGRWFDSTLIFFLRR